MAAIRVAVEGRDGVDSRVRMKSLYLYVLSTSGRGETAVKQRAPDLDKTHL